MRRWKEISLLKRRFERRVRFTSRQCNSDDIAILHSSNPTLTRNTELLRIKMKRQIFSKPTIPKDTLYLHQGLFCLFSLDRSRNQVFSLYSLSHDRNQIFVSLSRVASLVQKRKASVARASPSTKHARVREFSKSRCVSCVDLSSKTYRRKSKVSV